MPYIEKLYKKYPREKIHKFLLWRGLNKLKPALVIGGGIAGMQSALDLADQGIKVYLVEKNPSLGGRMAQLDKTFPTLDCSSCILTPKMVDVSRHENIELMTYRITGHSRRDPALYQPKDEKKQAKENEPIKRFSEYLTSSGFVENSELEQINQETEQLIEQAVKNAQAAPEPKPASGGSKPGAEAPPADPAPAMPGADMPGAALPPAPKPAPAGPLGAPPPAPGYPAPG